MYRHLIFPLVAAYSMGDNEKAHDLAKRVAKKLDGMPTLLKLIAWWYEANNNPAPYYCEPWGVTFPNRVGLSAGFDKDGEMLLALQAVGFGFVEVGTVLPREQAGNLRPRMFRLREHKALINRMRFNSLGASAVFDQLYRQRESIKIPLGMSFTKHGDTSIEDAAGDIVECIWKLGEFAAYIVLNVSSPNTPELQKLQGVRYIEELVRTTRMAEESRAASVGTPPRAIVVKLAPDLTDAEIVESTDAARRGGCRGFIWANTTMSRPVEDPLCAEAGGLSGDPLFAISSGKKLDLVRDLTDGLPLIYVGGLNSGDRVRQVLDKGVDLVQIYTGLVYEGLSLLSEARRVADTHQVSVPR